jgi:DNA-binding Lrp family transcriptional regulator
MQTVFVQVKCELGKVYSVAEQAIELVDKISEIHSTSGQFDLLIKCYLDDSDDVGHFINDKIQTLTGVKDTYTLITFKAFS